MSHKSFLIVGNGRLSKHFQHYFSLLGLDYQMWCRAECTVEDLYTALVNVSHVLLLLPDDAIVPFVLAHKLTDYRSLVLVHCSGAQTIPGVYGAHPLQTFSNDLYNLVDYQKIPFVIESEAPDLLALIPGLANPFYRISHYQKPYYHAWCVMANNFSTILWQQFMNRMQSLCGFNEADLMPILQQTAYNLQNDRANALTGPMVRQDLATISNNLSALEGDPFYTVYKAFADMPTEVLIK